MSGDIRVIQNILFILGRWINNTQIFFFNLLISINCVNVIMILSFINTSCYI